MVHGRRRDPPYHEPVARQDGPGPGQVAARLSRHPHPHVRRPQAGDREAVPKTRMEVWQARLRAPVPETRRANGARLMYHHPNDYDDWLLSDETESDRTLCPDCDGTGR